MLFGFCGDVNLMKWALMSGVLIFCRRFAARTAVWMRGLCFCIHDLMARGVLVFHWASGVSNTYISEFNMHRPLGIEGFYLVEKGVFFPCFWIFVVVNDFTSVFPSFLQCNPHFFDNLSCPFWFTHIGCFDH